MDRRTWKEPVDERIVADGVFLEYRGVLRIARGKGLLLAARGGTLWITEAGDRRDLIVTNGRWYRLKTDGLAIINALEPTSVTISAPLGIPARWRIDGAGVSIRPGTRGNRAARNFWAWVLRRYRSGAHAARRVQQSVRDAQQRAEIARLAAQLDARTRRDIGLEQFYGASPAERAERYRWRHDLSWPARERTFI